MSINLNRRSDLGLRSQIENRTTPCLQDASRTVGGDVGGIGEGRAHLLDGELVLTRDGLDRFAAATVANVKYLLAVALNGEEDAVDVRLATVQQLPHVDG